MARRCARASHHAQAAQSAAAVEDGGAGRLLRVDAHLHLGLRLRKGASYSEAELLRCCGSSAERLAALRTFLAAAGRAMRSASSGWTASSTSPCRCASVASTLTSLPGQRTAAGGAAAVFRQPGRGARAGPGAAAPAPPGARGRLAGAGGRAAATRGALTWAARLVPGVLRLQTLMWPVGPANLCDLSSKPGVFQKGNGAHADRGAARRRVQEQAALAGLRSLRQLVSC